MTRQYYKYVQPHDPIVERVGRDMFTDRETEMDYLMNWANSVARQRQKSIALVSPRRYGKTAILERFYNRLFWERDDIIPFYYELHRDPIYILKFIHEYYLAFLRQFVAYGIRDPQIAFDLSVDERELYKLAEEVQDEHLMRDIEIIPKLLEDGFETFFRVALTAPQRYAARTGMSAIVMFDEFQRLDQVLYYDEDRTRKCHPSYTDAFGSVVESSVAPMLIAGSQMTILTRQALSKGMAGRVARTTLKRMSLQASAELAIKLAREQGIELSLDFANTIARLAWRHPYYIWCLFNTRRVDNGLNNEQDVRDRLAFEIENDEGLINRFWREHFVDNMDALNEPDAKKMAFYLMKRPDRQARVDEIVEDLALTISKEEANRQLRKLVWGDLITQISLGGTYGGVSDPMLERVLRLEYSWELQNAQREDVVAQIEQELAQETIAAQTELIGSLRGELNNWVGRIAEVFIEKLMKRFFTGQTVAGETYFHHPHDVKLSRFKRVYTTFAQPFGATRPYQIDICAEPEDENEPAWVVESKNWQKPVDKPTVEHFLRAAENLATDRGHENIICWFHARSSFTKPAQTLLEEKNILYTEHDELMQMLQDFDIVEQW